VNAAQSINNRPVHFVMCNKQKYNIDTLRYDTIEEFNVIGHFSGKNRVKFGNFVNFSGNNLKLLYIVNYYLVLFHDYDFLIIFGLGLGLNLQKLASASAS